VHPIPIYSPRAEISGLCLLGMARGLEGFGLPMARVLALLEEQGIQAPTAQGWHGLEPYLAFLEDVRGQFGPEALRAMGRAIPDTSRFPPELDSLERALRLLDVAYQVNHRGGPIGRYQARFREGRRAEVICENPYPCELDQGILERLVARYGGAEEAEVIHRPGPECRRLGGRACRFDLRW